MSKNEVLSQWLDPDEVRSLAEGLLATTPVTQMPSHESVFGKSFEGFDDESAPPESVPVPVAVPAPPMKAVRVEQKPTKIVAEPVTPVPQPDSEPEPAPPVSKEPQPPTQPDPFRKDLSRVAPTAPAQKASPFKVASSQKPAPKSPPVPPSLPKALDTFAGWLKKQAPIQAAFLCDPKGKVVLDEIGSEKLIKVARSLSLASLSKGAAGSGGLLQVKIAKDRMMEILPLKSEEGHSIAGLVVARPLASEALVTIRRSFEAALSRSSTSGE
jgi:hypothetical protein